MLMEELPQVLEKILIIEDFIELIDFYRLDKKDIPAKVETIEYDPNRTAFIMLVCYKDGERRYHLAPEGIKVGDEIICSESAPIKIGNRLTIKKYSLPGTEIYEVELVPRGRKAYKISRF
jgi:large subunit ribosomal protein L2